MVLAIRFNRIRPFAPFLNINLSRSKWALKPKVLWEERTASLIAFNTNFFKKTAKLKQKTVLKPSINGGMALDSII